MGGHPSPILPDGTMISLPIPNEGNKHTYQGLKFNDKSFWDIMKELSITKNLPENCHCDPDINKAIMPRHPDWRPAFGQCNTAQAHLENQEVEPADVFLFYGWFSSTAKDNGILKYKYDDSYPSDIHVIFGYMQIGEILNGKSVNTEKYKWLKYHPHWTENDLSNNSCGGCRRGKCNNTIYIASPQFSFAPEHPGAGVFNYDQSLVLTKKHETRSKWNLPKLFKDCIITYHSTNSWKDEGHFQSAKIGQEFIVDVNDKALNWMKKLIINNL